MFKTSGVFVSWFVKFQYYYQSYLSENGLSFQNQSLQNVDSPPILIRWSPYLLVWQSTHLGLRDRPQPNKAAWSPSPPSSLNFIQLSLEARSHHPIIVWSLFSALDNPCPGKILYSLKFRKKSNFSVKFYQKPFTFTGQNRSFSPWVDTTRIHFDPLAL